MIAMGNLTIESENVIENLAGILKGRVFNNTVSDLMSMQWGNSDGKHDLVYHAVDLVTGAHRTYPSGFWGKFNGLRYTFPMSPAAFLSSGQGLTLELSETILNKGSSIYSGGVIATKKEGKIKARAGEGEFVGSSVKSCSFDIKTKKTF